MPQHPGDRTTSNPLPPRAAAAVAEAHRAIDARVAAFAHATGIACPPSCGRCCLSPDVESTVADLLPMATEIVACGDGGAVLEAIRGRGGDRRCVMYVPDPDDAARGRCSMYAHRPSICRLFGFAGRRDADGIAQFTPCRVHALEQPEIAVAARAAARSGTIALPIFGDLATLATASAPDAPPELRPINDALRAAIERVGLAERLAAEATPVEDRGDDGTPGRPTTPRRPLRPAA